jgi:hypothetical protein
MMRSQVPDDRPALTSIKYDKGIEGKVHLPRLERKRTERLVIQTLGAGLQSKWDVKARKYRIFS